jgi:hypothetical protein
LRADLLHERLHLPGAGKAGLIHAYGGDVFFAGLIVTSRDPRIAWRKQPIARFETDRGNSSVLAGLAGYLELGLSRSFLQNCCKALHRDWVAPRFRRRLLQFLQSGLTYKPCCAQEWSPIADLRAEFFRQASCRQVRHRAIERPLRCSVTVFSGVMGWPFVHVLNCAGGVGFSWTRGAALGELLTLWWSGLQQACPIH